MGYSFQLSTRILLYAPSYQQDSTYHDLYYTSRGALAGTRNSSMGLPWGIDLTTHRTMSEDYHRATPHSWLTERVIVDQSCIRWVQPTGLGGVPLLVKAMLVTLIARRSEMYLCGKSIRSWRNRLSDRSFMVDPLSYFSFQPVSTTGETGHGMCHPVCGMVYIKEPLLLIGKSSPCGSSRFPLSLSEWSFTICLTPYNRK